MVVTALFSNVGGPGSIFGLVGAWLGYAIGLAGTLNAVLYVVYRGIDYHSA